MGIALKAEDVSIRYITGDFKDIGIKEYATRRLANNYHVKEFMAVDGVSFVLENGDMLGIIGANGAGKSTLLKAVAGIMEPTRGKITANGEVAALLELGSGFDGDLTVRENAYLRGAMLGYTKDFMDETYVQIIGFAELEEFEERPFKQLSSGMKSRLAFSIASLVDPDILILDEVLSVGDGAFQEKSAQKMREIIAGGATTILVSHSLNQIRELCNKVLWLDHGKQIAFGEAKDICDQYERFLRGECPAEMPNALEKAPSEPITTVVAPIAVPSEGKQHRWTRALVAGLVLALFTGVTSYMALKNYQASHPPMQSIYITADDSATGAVSYRGTFVNGDWCSPRDTVVFNENWIVNEEEDIRTAVDTQPLEVRLRTGETWGIVFDCGPNEGRAIVSTDHKSVEIDLFSETEMPLGIAYDVSVLADMDTPQNYVSAKVVAAILALIVFLIVVLFARNPPPVPGARKSGCMG